MNIRSLTSWLWVSLFIATPHIVRADDFLSEHSLRSELRVGHWIEVRGTQEANTFIADRIELRTPRNKAVVWGVVHIDSDGNPQVLGRPIAAHNIQLPLDELVGRRVRLKGQLDAQGRFIASSCEPKKPGASRIEGRIDSIQSTPDGDLKLRVLGFDVQTTPSSRERIRGPIDDISVALPLNLISSSSSVGDFDDTFGDGFQLGASLQIGVQQDITANFRRNFELDQRNDTDIDPDDDRDDFIHRVRARMTWFASERVSTVVDVDHQLRQRVVDRAETGHRSRTRLREAFVLVRNAIAGSDLIVGRQDFDDPREWLYDQSLDGVRLFTQTKNLNIETSLSTTLGIASDRDKHSRNAIVYISNRTGPRHYAAYAIHRDFAQDTNGKQTHTGVRFDGPVFNHLDAWLDLSVLTGSRDGRDVRAWGTDAGIRWVLHQSTRTALTFSYAVGSGGGDGSTDRQFRQTGFQDNNDKLVGTTAVRYYGELFDPELSNIEISTVGLGRRFLGKNSVEIKAHKYKQAHTSTRLVNTNVDRRPNGLSRDLGWEIDLVVGVREFRNWEFEIVGAYFKPGDALGSRDSATMANLNISYRY